MERVRLAVAWLTAPLAWILNVIVLVASVAILIVAKIAMLPFEGKPDFSPDRLESLERRAREIFQAIADRHGLTLKWDESSPVEVACTLPVQPRLDIQLWLNLQNCDELGVQTDYFSAEWFPADDPEREEEFIACVDGIITGRIRLICSFGISQETPYKVKLQQEQPDGTWKTIYRYYRAWVEGWPPKRRIIRNEPIGLRVRPA